MEAILHRLPFSLSLSLFVCALCVRACVCVCVCVITPFWLCGFRVIFEVERLTELSRKKFCDQGSSFVFMTRDLHTIESGSRRCFLSICEIRRLCTISRNPRLSISTIPRRLSPAFTRTLDHWHRTVSWGNSPVMVQYPSDEVAMRNRASADQEMSVMGE